LSGPSGQRALEGEGDVEEALGGEPVDAYDVDAVPTVGSSFPNAVSAWFDD